MTLKENKTPAIVYTIIAALAVIAMVAFGITYKPAASVYLWGGGIWAAGIVVMIVQIAKSGDTNAAPYVMQVLGAAVFGYLAAGGI